MSAKSFALAALVTAAGLALPPASAQTPAEQASRALNRELARDRLRDAAEDARAADTARAAGALPPPSAGAQQIEQDRAAIRPGLGRPEERGRLPGVPRTTDADPNGTR